MEDELTVLGRRLAAWSRAEQGLPAQVDDAEVFDLFTDLAARPLGREANAPRQARPVRP